MLLKSRDTTVQSESVSVEITPCFHSNISHQCSSSGWSTVLCSGTTCVALKDGVSKTQRSSNIVLSRKLNYNAHCKVEFGEYGQTHEEHNNGMTSRTFEAIATRPSDDAGLYYFISLQTGCRINRRSWTSLSIPEAVVSQVHRLAHRAKTTKKLPSPTVTMKT